jgi:uroporphyrin-III C-methyltransferase/precorrin-2 dehydrogenase/sirohydrochlorin ferrochelatase
MAARIAPLAALPLFHKLDGRRVLLAGSSDAALWKAELLAATGAELLIAAGNAEGALRYRLVEELSERVTVLPRAWLAEDFETGALAIFGDADGGESFVAAARNAGVPVNVIDRPELCDVQFGTIVNRSPLVIGISSGGGAPMLGQWLRERIEAMLPARIGDWARAALEWRPQVKAAIKNFADRRSFWASFVELAWNAGDRAPRSADVEALIDAAAPSRGEVLLVGAGPGDPALLTLGALRALQRGTVILYDDLVSPEVLELARREARRIAVGKKGHGRSCRQEHVNAELVRLALAGETVVRLKGGDPLIFGRASEELEACRRAGVPVSIVPGISAAQAAAASLGISLTERDHARRVQFVTGHGADGALPADLGWSAIADPNATSVVYMPRRTIADFVEQALGSGLAPDHPAALVANASLETEQQRRGTLAELPAMIERFDASAPTLVILGKVARESAAAEPSDARAAA